MHFQIRYDKLSIGYFILCGISLILFMCIDMQGQEADSPGVPGANTMTCLFAMVFVCAIWKFFVIPGYKAYRPSVTMLLYLAYMLWILIPVLTNRIYGDSVTQIATIVKLLIPFFSLLLPFNYLLNHGDSKAFGWVLCFTSVLFAVTYFKVMYYFLSISPLDAPHMIISYYTLYLLPLIMLTCGNKRRIVFTIFTALVLITSVKRGGILALGVGLVAYGFVLMRTAKKIKASTVIAVLIVIGILAAMFIILADSDENDLMERIANMQDDEGSGRTVVWGQTIRIIEKSDMSSLIFGHGFYAVAYDSNAAKSAHNDFLEIIYDYGIIGLVLYVMAVLSLIIDTAVQAIKKTVYAAPMAMLVTIYLFLSMMSHIAIYTWFNIILYTLGYVEARKIIDKRERNE